MVFSVLNSRFFFLAYEIPSFEKKNLQGIAALEKMDTL